MACEIVETERWCKDEDALFARLNAYVTPDISRICHILVCRTARQGGIETPMHLLTSLEDRYSFFRHRHHIAGSRIAARARTALLYRERPETTKLNPVPSCESITDGVEDRVHDLLDVTRIQMWVLLRQLSDQFGFKHVWRKPLM
jgi:hypothetical protein